jgi:sulfoxide reductase heme-binding subunit YedZ
VTTAPAVWYLLRATGVVALLLLTGAVVLGIATSNRWAPARLPRFVTSGLHRSVALLATAYLGVHVLTALLDADASVRLVDVFVPFGAAAAPLWVGLGALSLDVLAAVVVTSLLRRRLGNRTWRAVHWGSYGAWPLALLHGIGMGSDVATPWLLGVELACIAAVGAAVSWRLLAGESATIA